MIKLEAIMYLALTKVKTGVAKREPISFYTFMSLPKVSPRNTRLPRKPSATLSIPKSVLRLNVEAGIVP